MQEFCRSILKNCTQSIKDIELFAGSEAPADLKNLPENDFFFFFGFSKSEYTSYERDINFYSIYVTIIDAKTNKVNGVVRIELIDSDFKEVEVHCVGIDRKNINSSKKYVYGMIKILDILLENCGVNIIRAKTQIDNSSAAKFIHNVGFDLLRMDSFYKYYFLNRNRLSHTLNRVHNAN
jgi:hypothetical protein